MKCIECKERERSSDAQWLLLDEDGYRQIRPLCQEHYEEICHEEGEENLNLIYLNSDVASNVDLEELITEVNKWLNYLKKRIAWFSDELRKKEVSGKSSMEVCKIGQLHHEIAIDLQVAKDMKSLGEPYPLDGFIKVLEHYKEMVSGEKKVEET